MIKINYKLENGIFNKIEILGHSGYAESGKDIVCAAVSATLLTTINNIKIINKDVITSSIEEGDASICLIKKIEEKSIINLILLNMINEFKELEKDYPNYIEIRRC